MADEERSGPSIGVVVAGVLVVLLVWFWIVNRQTVTVTLLVGRGHDLPLSLALVLSGVLGFVIGWFVGRRRD